MDDVLAFLAPWKYDKNYGHGHPKTEKDNRTFSPQVQYSDSLKSKIDAEIDKNTTKRVKLTVFTEMYDWETKHSKDPVDAIYKNIKKGTDLAKDLFKNYLKTSLNISKSASDIDAVFKYANKKKTDKISQEELRTLFMAWKLGDDHDQSMSLSQS